MNFRLWVRSLKKKRVLTVGKGVNDADDNNDNDTDDADDADDVEDANDADVDNAFAKERKKGEVKLRFMGEDSYRNVS